MSFSISPAGEPYWSEPKSSKRKLAKQTRASQLASFADQVYIASDDMTLETEQTLKPIRDIVDVSISQRSQWPSRNSFVVQAWSNVDGWQDTKEGATTPETAYLRATMLLERDSSWIGQHRLVRIVPCLYLK